MPRFTALLLLALMSLSGPAMALEVESVDIYKGATAVLGVVVIILLLVIVALWLKLRIINDENQELEQIDLLTGAYSRQFAWQQAEKLFSEAKRYNFPVAVLRVSVNDLKSLNDIYGEEGGDYVLKVVGERLLSVVRDTDILGRFSSSGFMVMLPHTPHENVKYLIKRIEAGVEKSEVTFNGNDIYITLSMGAASVAEDAVEDLNSLIGVADRRMEKAKNKVTQQVVLKD